MPAFEMRQGGVLEELAGLGEGSVNCCVTSPPYYGLRDYGTGVWEGGEAGCGHEPTRGIQGKSGVRAGRRFTAELQYRGKCNKCGAVRVDQQIGLEETLEEYLGKLVEVFREVFRVLRDDGTCWVNMGDSYAQSGGSGAGRKQKDLMGVPWELAFALRRDGWWLRRDIIWNKPNPMPESVKDRPTTAHEYIFLLSKSVRYHYDADAVKEPASQNSHARYAKSPSGWRQSARLGGAGIAPRDRRQPGVNPKAKMSAPGSKQNASFSAAVKDLVEFRNMRSVWTMATEPTPEAHFATFPIALAERCILAGCPEGGLVLDPFAGSGTTGLAALKHGRRFLGVELNPEYVGIAMRRAAEKMPLLLG